MKVTVTKYVEDHHKDFRLGWAACDLAGKMSIIVGVYQSKEAKTFCMFPNVKIRDKFMAAYTFPKEVQEDILRQASEQIIALLAPKIVEPPHG